MSERDFRSKGVLAAAPADIKGRETAGMIGVATDWRTGLAEASHGGVGILGTTGAAAGGGGETRETEDGEGL